MSLPCVLETLQTAWWVATRVAGPSRGRRWWLSSKRLWHGWFVSTMKQLFIEVLIPPWRGFSLSAPGLAAGRARWSFGADEEPFRHFPRTSKGIFLFFVFSLLAGSSTHQWMIFAAKNNRYRCFWILLCACFQEPDAGFTWHNGLTFIFKGTHTAQLTSWDLPIWMFPTKKCDQNSWQKLFKHFKCLIIKKTNMFQK